MAQPTTPSPTPAPTPRTMPADPGDVKALRFAKVLTWFVYAYFVLALIVLTLYFFLLLFNASPDAGFTEWVYRSADRAMEPFRGIFPTAEGANGSVLDFAVLFAMIVYGIVVMLLRALIDWVDRKILEGRRKAAWLAGADRSPV